MMLRALRNPTSLLVTLARLRVALFGGMAKRLAEDYESHRKGARWSSEERAFAEFIARLQPKTVLDCPVGTGRWLDAYQASGASVRGVDLSPHMLRQARGKLKAGARVELVEADVLDPAQRGALGTGHDLIVCTRFTHWLPTRKVAELVDVFQATGSRHLIVGAKVRRETPVKRGRPRGAVAAVKSFWSGTIKPRFNHIHEERDLLDIFAGNGRTVLVRRPIISTRSSLYVYYLVEFPGSAAGSAA